MAFHALLENISDAEKSLVTPKGPRSDALPAFMEWLASHGAEMGPVKVVEQPLYGCCVIAKTDIKEGELLFTIPQQLMLSTETAQNSELGL